MKTETLPLLCFLIRHTYMDDAVHHMHRKRWFIFSGLLVSLAFFVGVSIGVVYNVQNELLDENKQVDISKVAGLYSSTRSDTVDFEQYWQIWDRIKEKHVDQPISDIDLFYGSLKGLVDGIGDPHSVYFPPTEARQFAQDLQGEFGGIGAEIGIKGEQLSIIAPLPGSPAEKAGLKALDKILKIDEKETLGMSLDEAVSSIRGPRGTAVKLTITRNGFESAQEIEIMRDIINIPTVVWEEKKPDIIYLRIAHFNNKTVIEFDKTIKEILLKTPKGLILDLRSNPGGYLDAAISIASEWVEKGVIVRERFTDQNANEYPSAGLHRLKDMPTVVLVDEASASASEIVAGALQDYKRARVVGTKTFGKGSVQDFEFLSDGSALKLTVAKWFTPLDRQIDGEGIVPDIILEKMFDTGTEDTDEIDPEKAVDLGIEKALELLSK